MHSFRRLLRRSSLAALAATLALAPALRAADQAPAATPDKASAAAATTPPPTPPPSFWEQDTLTDGWWGYRDKLGDAGISPFGTWTGEIWDNTQGGIRNGMTLDMMLSTGVDADFQKLAGWTGGSGHAEFHWEQGKNVDTNTGAFNNPSSFIGNNTVRVYSVYLEQKLLGDQLSLRAGQFGADQDFFQLDSAGLFLNAGMTAPPSLYGQVLANSDFAIAQYPLADPALFARFKPKDLPIDAQAGIFNGDPGPDNTNNHGFDWKTGNGVLVLGEVGYHFNLPNLPGTVVKAGGFYHSGEFTNWNTGNTENNIYGGYVAVDQVILQTPGAKPGDDPTPIVTFFAFGGLAGPASRVVPSSTAAAGFNWHGAIPGRDNDVVGVAVLYTGFSSDFTASTTGAVTASETVLEVTYQAQITPWFTVQPDAQAIFNPALAGTRQTAIVIGARAVLTF